MAEEFKAVKVGREEIARAHGLFPGRTNRDAIEACVDATAELLGTQGVAGSYSLARILHPDCKLHNDSMSGEWFVSMPDGDDWLHAETGKTEHDRPVMVALATSATAPRARQRRRLGEAPLPCCVVQQVSGGVRVYVG